MFFLLPTVGSLVDNRAYFALYLGGTSSLEQTTVPIAANSSRTVCICYSTLICKVLHLLIHYSDVQYVNSFFFQFGQMDGSTEAQATRKHVPKLHQLHEEEVLSSAFLQPETIGLLLSSHPYCQWSSIHCQSSLL